MKPSLIIVGLGNPGKAYEHTRHNLGYLALDSLVETFGEGEWEERKKFQSVVYEGRIVTVPVLFVKPTTFMNNSGEALRKIVDFYKLNPAEQIIVLFDDIDLPLGTLRLRKKGGPGTHNGMKSIVEQLGEDFPRLKLGLGSPPKTHDLATWILSGLSAEEGEAVEKMFHEMPLLLKDFVLEEDHQKEGD